MAQSRAPTEQALIRNGFGRRLGFAVLVTFLVVPFCASCDQRDELQRFQMRATTAAYKEAALEVLLAEVNQVARELGIPENFPIKSSDLQEIRINTSFWTEITGALGSVSTSNYFYFASVGNRLSSIEPNFGPNEIRGPAFNEFLRERYALPKSRMNTNAAYLVATQLLGRAGIDTHALERDAQRVEIGAWEIGKDFVPVYSVSWRRLSSSRADLSPPKLEALAFIQFVEPERRVVRLTVNQAKYVDRKPLVVADRDSLLQKTDDPKLRELFFTTQAYKEEATKVMLKEVNWAAHALGLAEAFPVRASNLTDIVIGTPYVADHQGLFAMVCTEKYNYGARQKLMAVSRPCRFRGEEDNYIASLKIRYAKPRSQLNPRIAYTLATQWLASISVDIERLEMDYPSEINPLWISEDQFVPLYTVEWVKGIEGSRRRDVAAMVEVLEPERSLEQLLVERPEYMTRAALVVPDREKLLQVPK